MHEVGSALVRLLFVSQWFPPEPSRVPIVIAKSLERLGSDVSVVTGTPNFPTGSVQPGWSPWRFRRARHDGIDVLHSPLYPSHDASSARRMLNYLTFSLAATFGVLGWSKSRGADVVLVYSSPATAAIPAMALRLLKGTPYVLFIQDLWPDSVTATGYFHSRPGRLAAIILNQFVKWTYALASDIAVISPGMRTELIDRGVPRGKVSVVYNWIGGDAVKEAVRERDEGSFTIVYGGNLGRAQGLDVAIRAVAQAGEGVALQFVGSGIEQGRLQALANELAPDRVTFTPRMPVEEFRDVAAAADAMLVALAPEPLFEITLPGKVQGALALGLPIIASAGRDVRELVSAAEAGWVAESGDVAALVRAIDEARRAGCAERRRRGISGRMFFESQLSEGENAGRLYRLLSSAARSRSRF